jgi:hypothetical protein
MNIMKEPRWEIVRADQLEERVLAEILRLRNPEFRYEGQPLTGYSYIPYQRELGFTQHARQGGILTVPGYNREISNERVKKYRDEMCEGLWRTCYSDPITITAEGDVINGQHRLAAASGVDWNSGDGPDAAPSFVVIWNISPQEARFADGSHRTRADEKIVLGRLLDGNPAPPENAASQSNSPSQTGVEEEPDSLPQGQIDAPEENLVEELRKFLRANSAIRPMDRK